VIADQDLSRLGRSQRHRRQLEVLRFGQADGAAFQADFAGSKGHGRAGSVSKAREGSGARAKVKCLDATSKPRRGVMSGV
jgi:hypothetical protein